VASLSNEISKWDDSDDSSVDLPFDFDNSPDASCNNTSFDKCNVNFAKELNITSPIRTALDFVKVLQKIMAKDGKNGFKKICKAFTNYKKCLGNSYSACINVDYFVKRGIKKQDAYIYVTVIYEFVYECSPGASKVILDNWDCISNVEKEGKVHMKKCVADFMKQVKKRPANVCPLAQRMVACIDFPFGRKCNPAVVSVICNTIKAGLKVSLPKCNISCPNATESMTTTDLSSNLEEFESVPETDGNLQQIDDEPLESVNVAFQSPFSTDYLSRMTDVIAQSCDDTKFRKAIDHYAQLFGFQVLPDNAMDFVKSVKSFLERQGKHGFKKTCDAGKEFYRRLGKDQFNLCVTQANFESLGYSQNDAFIYMDLAATMFYECGEGYDVYFANFDCIISTGKDKIDEITKCGQDFQTNVTTDPTKICDFAQSLLKCVEKPYIDSCSQEVGRAICMTGKAQLNHVLPDCKSLTCDNQGHVFTVPLKRVFKKHRRTQDDNTVRGGVGQKKFGNLFYSNELF
jgi:hypothetical protein